MMRSPRWSKAVSPAVLASLSSFIVATPVEAGPISGADILLRGTQKASGAGSGSASNAIGNTGFQSISEFKLEDPFSVQLYSSWQAIRSQLPPEVNHWVTLQLKQDFEAAAHLWGGVEKQLPSEFVLPARLARIRGLIQLGAVQVAVESWMEVLSQARGAWSSPGNPAAIISAFESSWSQFLGRSLDQVLADRGFLAPSELATAFLKLDAKVLPSIATLQAAASLRQGVQGRALLDLLPAQHAYKIPLAQTVSLALARTGDLGGAATVLKTHAETALEAQGNLVKVSSHLLKIARFLFQAGLWEESETYLRKIPNSAPEFLSAREELAWVLLRRGDIANLRGEVASLSTPATREEFHPELPVVRAISNLKLCSFGGVQKDFADFQSTYGKWASRIEAALASTDVPAPPVKDAFTRASERRVEELTVESRRLSELHARSLESGLPSVVGQQAHWKGASSAMISRVELGKKLVQAEYRRQWKNQKALLTEAIRKMRFVKIELLHQMRTLSAAPVVAGVDSGVDSGSDVISTSRAAAMAAPASENGQLVFPLDGVLWPDELFRIQGVVEQRCLKGLSQ